MNVAFFAPEVVACGIRCQKECFSALEVVLGRVWCTNGAFSAPEVVAQFSVRDLVPHRGH